MTDKVKYRRLVYLRHYYRGWTITYDRKRPETGKYEAESKGIILSARSRVEIERIVDQRIRDYPDDGHGRKTPA
jgi:hypothetical protein